MAATSLATIWSLQNSLPSDYHVAHPPATTSDSIDLNLWVVNTFVCNRVAIHFISTLFQRIPSSETRLRNEGFHPLYKGYCDIHNGLIEIALQNQISLPPCPTPAPDVDQEAEIDSEALSSTLVPYAPVPLKGLVDLEGRLARNDRGYHWGSLAAFMGVASDVFISQFVATKDSTMGDNVYSPFVQAMCSESLLEAIKVLREELVRCRTEAQKTGWKDEEARELAAEHLKYFEPFVSVGME